MAEANQRLAWSFEKRLFWTTLLIAFSFVPALVFALQSLYAASDAQWRLNKTFVRTLSLAQDLRNQQALSGALAPIFILSGNVVVLERLEQAKTAVEATVNTLRAMHLSASEAAILDQVVALRDKLAEEERPTFALRQAGRAIPEVDAFFREHAVPFIRSLNNKLVDLQADARQAYEARESDNEATIRRALFGLAASFLLAVVFMLLAARFLFRTVLNKKAVDLESELAAERVRAVAQARKEAVEVVAHDLKNPLSATMLLVEQMGQRVADKRSARMLDGISNAAGSMRMLISNLLDHAKIEAGPLALSLIADDLAPLLRTLAARCEILAARKGVQVVDDLPATLPPVAFDAVRLEQTFANLLGNAVKFTPSGGTVTLSGSADRHLVLLRVSDTGQGIAADQLTNVFERYWQAGETASWGTGLGLTIAKATIEAHGGTIAVESVRGNGSTFTVALPSVGLNKLVGSIATSSPSPKAMDDALAAMSDPLLPPSAVPSSGAG